MFRAITLPIFRSIKLCVTACGIMHPRCWVHYATSCNTQSGALEDRQNNFPKHVELTGIINKPLLLLLVGCLYCLYQWCTVKRISDNEIYLLTKCIKSVLWRVAKRLSYIQDAWRLEVNTFPVFYPKIGEFNFSKLLSWICACKWNSKNTVTGLKMETIHSSFTVCRISGSSYALVFKVFL